MAGGSIYFTTEIISGKQALATPSGDNTPFAAIWMVTYNHESYIRQAIESVMMQQTSFSYRLYIGEDCSTDGTREICRALKDKYPDKIELYLNQPNIGASANAVQIYQACFHSGAKYIAMLEGDDYWTDPGKLEAQVAFLEENPACASCFHTVDKLFEDGRKIEVIPQESKNGWGAGYLLRYGRPCHTCSFVFRNSEYLKQYIGELPGYNSGDLFLMLMTTMSGPMGRILRNMAVYRATAAGLKQNLVWRSSLLESNIKLAQFFNALNGEKYDKDVRYRINQARLIQLNQQQSFLGLIRLTFTMLTYDPVFFLKHAKAIFIKYLKWLYTLLGMGVMRRYLSGILRSTGKKIKTRQLLSRIKKNEPIENARILKNSLVAPYSGMVMDEKRGIYAESLFSLKKLLSLYSTVPGKISSQTECATVIEHGPWNNYYHWYIDVLPRLWGLQRPDFAVIERIELLLTKKLSQEEEGLLLQLIPANVKLRYVAQTALFKVRNFIFLPFLSQDCNGHLPVEYLDFFLNRAKAYFNLEKKPGTKIFITRKFAKSRKLENSEALEAWMIGQGFQVCALEQLSIREQAQLFYNAEIVVAQHGAGLTNLLYCRNGHTQVIEIFAAPNTHLHHYRGLCEAKGLRYTPVYLNGKGKNDTAYCDPRLIERALNPAFSDHVT